MSMHFFSVGRRICLSAADTAGFGGVRKAEERLLLAVLAAAAHRPLISLKGAGPCIRPRFFTVLKMNNFHNIHIFINKLR